MGNKNKPEMSYNEMMCWILLVILPITLALIVALMAGVGLL